MFQFRHAFPIAFLLYFSGEELYSDGFPSKVPTTRTPNPANTGKSFFRGEFLASQRDDDEVFEQFPDPTMTRSSFFGAAAALVTLPVAVAHASPDTITTNAVDRGNIADTTSQQQSKAEPNSFQESISGFVAGAALAASKTLIKFPLDTATVRLQMPNSDYSLQDPSRLFKGAYDGVTLSLLSNIPGGGVFFAVKDATKSILKSSALMTTAPKWVTTSLAVGAALIPYWIIRNPSEVIKVRQQAGITGYGEGVSAIGAIKETLNETNGTTLDVVEEFYTGYGENIIYGFPADVIKFVAYEAVTNGRRDLTPLEGAQAGAVATALAQLVTTPLDVIRNRLMAGSKDEKEKSYIQSLLQIARDEGIEGLFAGASPRVAKAFLSGAIQFATYEETKQSISRMLQR